MHCAAKGGHIEVIRFLLPLFGQRVHERTNDSSTMLHWAAHEGHRQLVCYLIDEVHMDPQDRDKVRVAVSLFSDVILKCIDICINRSYVCQRWCTTVTSWWFPMATALHCNDTCFRPISATYCIIKLCLFYCDLYVLHWIFLCWFQRTRSKYAMHKCVCVC